MNMPEPSTPATDLMACLARQRAAFLHAGPPSLVQRREDLERLRRALVAQREPIEAALQADFGHRSSHETTVFELMTVVEGIRYLQRKLRGWMKPQRRHVAIHFQPARAYVQYQPLGVIGIMSPWNYPLSLALMPLATALAAGNRAMLKPSEATPATSALLERLLAELFPPEKVMVIQGDASVGAAFSSLPFDHLLFTGGTEIGRKVMRAAADNLVPVTLELGGKSPVVVAPGHAAAAAESIAWGKLANAGQTCIAPDYALLHPQDVEPFVQAFDAAVKRMYPQGPTGADYSSIINARHYARLQGLVEDARAQGARIVEAGFPAQADSGRDRVLAPTLVLDAKPDMRVMQEEIFGPVLPVTTFAQIDEAIATINAGAHPLALYYFGPADAERKALLGRTSSGNVTVNNTLLHYAQDDLPFGGVGPSGMGAYHGIEGFRAMSHARGIFIQSRHNIGNLLRPPFGKLAEWVIKFMLR